MDTLLSWILATLITLPIVGYLIVFVCIKQVTKNHRKAVDAAMNFSTLLCIISVHFLILSIWETSLLWAILVAMIILAMLMVIVHHRIKGEIIWNKVLRGYWRLNGIVFLLAYCCLVVFGILKNMINIL